MLKKYLAKKAAAKSLKWIAKTEAKVLVTAAATIATHALIKKASKKFPVLNVLEPKNNV